MSPLPRAGSGAAQRVAENVTVANSYLDGTGPFPERAAILAVVGKLMTDLANAFAAWADWATSVLADWPDDPADAEPDTGHLRSDRPTRNHHAEQSPVQGAAMTTGRPAHPEARRAI